MKQNEIVHVALVLDASTSMGYLSAKLVEVAGEQIKALKARSEELDLQTRITVYTFADPYNIKCVIFDMDVFRLPSIEGLYHASGNTALIDATILSQNDLAKTAQMYGKHHFLTFVLTDGEENRSRNPRSELARILANQGPNWSVAALVPNETGKHYAEQYGFPANNILIWDVSKDGLATVGEKVTQAADNYMTSVSRGVAYDKTNVFGTGVDKVNASTVKALIPLTTGSYEMHDVEKDSRIDEFVKMKGRQFFVGKGFYTFTKMETIQRNKQLIVVEKATGIAYGGAGVRGMLGLPTDTDVRVKPNHNPDYLIAVQSTANNRKLLAGTKLVWTF